MLHPCQRRAVLPLLLAAACLVSPLASAQYEADQAPANGAPAIVAAVSVSSYQKVLDDVGYIGGLVDKPQAAQMVEGMIAMFTQGQGLVGLDRDRPWCLLVQSSGQDFSPLVCLPVTDLEGLLALGVNAGVTTEDMGDGVQSVSAQGQTYFVKSNGEWVFAAQRADQLATLPASPADMLGDLANEYDIAVKLMAQNVPPMFKQLAIGQLRQGMQEGLERRPDETDAQFEARSELAEANIANIEDMINDLDQALVGISINPDGGGLVIDFRGSAVEGSKLADQFAIYNSPSGTRLAGFMAEDASLSMASAYTIPDGVKARILEDYEKQMDTARTAVDQMLEEAELPNDEVRDTVKSAVEDLLSCAEAMVRSGEIDTVGNIQLKMGGASAIFALRTPSPEKIDSAFKKLAALAEGDPNFPINWAAETYEGVTMHTLSVPIADPEAQDVLGAQANAVVGIGADAAYFSFGPDAAGALKQAITNSASGVKEVKPVQMSVELAQVMEFAGAVAEASGEDAAVPQMMAQLLKDADGSQINITLDGESNGMRYRLRVDEGVLQAIGKAAAEMQRAQMQ